MFRCGEVYEAEYTEKVNMRRWKMFNCLQRSLPAYARVKQSRVPNAYDKTALRLEVRIKSLDSKNPRAVGVRTFLLKKRPLLSYINCLPVPAGVDDPPCYHQTPFFPCCLEWSPSLVIIKHHYFAAGLFDDLAPGDLKWQHLFLFKAIIYYINTAPTNPKIFLLPSGWGYCQGHKDVN